MATKKGVVADKGVVAKEGVDIKGVAVEEGVTAGEGVASEGEWPLRQASCSTGTRVENKTHLLGPDKVVGSQTCVYFLVR